MKNNKLVAFDNKFEIINKKINDNGYLVIKCIFARTGIQERYGFEINSDFEQDKLYKEYRSAKEVFNSKFLKSLRNITITNNHPDEMLNETNTKLHAIGFVSSEIEIIDNQYLQCEITIYDENTIADIEAGKVELSAGYWSQVKLVEHDDYDYEQINLKANHIAIVEAGRCGSSCALSLDSKFKKRKIMKIVFKRFLPNGEEEVVFEIEISNEDEAKKLEVFAKSYFEKSKKMLEASVAADEEVETSKKDTEEAVAEVKELTEANDALQAKLDAASKRVPSKDCKVVQTAAKDLAAVMVVAKDLGIELKDKNSKSLKIEIVAKTKPAVSFDSKSDVYVDTMYDLVAAELGEADNSYLMGLNSIASESLDKLGDEAESAKAGFNTKFGGNE